VRDLDILFFPIGVPLAIGVAVVLLHNAASRTYWSFAVAVALLVFIVSLVFDAYPYDTLHHSALSLLVTFLIPLCAGFAAGRMPFLRMHPIAALVGVPVCYLAAVFISITVALNLGLPH